MNVKAHDVVAFECAVTVFKEALYYYCHSGQAYRSIWSVVLFEDMQ